MSRDSRLSMASSSVTSSRLSVASSASDNSCQGRKAGSSLFPRRWEDEREMDKSLKILKRKQAATARLRKANSVADRILEGKVRDIDSHFNRLSKQLRKETNYIQCEFRDIKPIKLPRIDSSENISPDSGRSRATPTTSARSESTAAENQNLQSPKSPRTSRTSRSPKCRTCLFDPENTKWRCKHFPCFLPVTYHSMGMYECDKTYSVVGNYDQLLQRCNDLRPATSKLNQSEETVVEEEDIDLESRAPRTTVKEKIRGLKQLVKEMKEKNEKQKPRDWAVNYGTPTPRRIILKPVKT